MLYRADEMQGVIVPVDYLVRGDLSGYRMRREELVGETERLIVHRAPGHASFAVRPQHHLVDQTELVVHVLADVPMDAEERIATHLHSDDPPAGGESEQR